MATVTRENLGLLNDKLTVTITRDEYFPAFEKTLKNYSKQANIPGFRKGMVPAGMVKKMYGQGIFAEEVIRTIEKGLNDYLTAEQPDIFAQPLPLPNPEFRPSMDNPTDYTFSFEIGLKPAIELGLNKLQAPYYRVKVTPEMTNEEAERLQRRLGKLTEPEAVASEENVLNLLFEASDAEGTVAEGITGKEVSLLVKYFTESFRPRLMGLQKDATLVLQLNEAFEEKERDWVLNDLGLKDDPAAGEGHFRVTLVKLGLVEKRELDEAFFQEALPGRNIQTEAEFRQALEADIQSYWDRQSSNQLHHHLYHVLLEQTPMELPEAFLKKWLTTSGEKPKTPEQVDAEFPTFLNQLRWTLITDKIVGDNQLQVSAEELKGSFRQQVLSYFGSMSLGDGNLEWLDQYVDSLMKDEQQVDSTYRKLITEKVFQWAEQQVGKEEKEISAEEFIRMNEEHQHQHH
ncbi:MAG TPA: trigger factor [Lacibacter sp.]|nr:trigger factor [Lacibacter sp.]HMO87902.1 trigger factor [Lacibacter sp.]HMP87355.1 trigger factor [Lacibacter sp.]